MRIVLVRRKHLLMLAGALLAFAVFWVVNAPATVATSVATRQLPIYCVERDDKMLSFYGDYQLNHGYFLHSCKAEGYMRLHAVGEVIYSIYRMILQENGILFQCNRRLEDCVASAPMKPENIVALGRAAAEKQDDASIDAFAKAYFDWSKYPFPSFGKAYSRYVADFEQWWYVQRPNVNEW